MPVSKKMWLRGIYIDARKMKDQARADRDLRKKEITQKWKEGVKALTIENDRLQAADEAAFHKEIDDIDAMTAAQIAQGPPA